MITLSLLDSCKKMLIVYVNDIVLSGSIDGIHVNKEHLQKLVIKDLGKLSYFSRHKSFSL